MAKLNLRIVLLLTCIPSVSYSQTKQPSIQQKSERSTCANIVALAGNLDINCASLTPAQKKAFADIPNILKMALSNQDYLNAILAKLDEMSKAGLAQQGNSGGINIQQGTAGDNSPIINSPITVGTLPKAISPADMVTLKAYFLGAKNKAKIQIMADQYSGAAPFPDDFYDALKGGGWEMVDAGVTRMEVFSAPGRKFQGAIVTVNGDPIPEGQGVTVDASDPLAYIGYALQSFKIPRTLSRNKNQPKGTISITFSGGFPE